MSPDQHELHLAPENPSLPEGFVYRPDVLSVPPSRTEWEHNIPAVDALRYSITIRSLAAAKTSP